MTGEADHTPRPSPSTGSAPLLPAVLHGPSRKDNMSTDTLPRRSVRGILADEHLATRRALIEMLHTAYRMELEIVMSYLASAINAQGIRAQGVAASLRTDIHGELDHAQRFAERIAQLQGLVPGPLDFRAQRSYLQPAATSTDVIHVLTGLIDAHIDAIEHYDRIIEVSEGIDWVTHHLAIEILQDEEGHRQLFQGYLRECRGHHAG